MNNENETENPPVKTKPDENPPVAKPPLPTASVMPTGTLLLTTGNHCTMHVLNATPAEALFLTIEHMANAGKAPVSLLQEGEPVERSAKAEVNRLKHKYSSKKLGIIFGKIRPELPETFEEAIAAGVEFASTTSVSDKEPLLTQTLI